MESHDQSTIILKKILGELEDISYLLRIIVENTDQDSSDRNIEVKERSSSGILKSIDRKMN